MKILPPRSAASPRPLAPAVAVAGVATVPQEGENLVPAEEAPAGVVLGEPVVDRPFTVAAELWFQPIAFRWAMNLKPYTAMEAQRFVGYYQEMASASGVMLAHATVTR